MKPGPGVTSPARTLAIPADWEPIGRICARLLDGFDVLTDRIVQSIVAEVPGYGENSPVPTEDLRASVSGNLEMMLVGTAERRGPVPDEIEARRDLGRRRAQQGLPVDSLIQAYLVGYRDIWLAMVAEADNTDPHTSTLMFHAVTIVWSWIHQISLAISVAYHEATREMEARTESIRRQFLEALLHAQAGAPDVRDLAVGLGFDPDGDFAAVCVAGTKASTLATTLPRRLSEGDGPVECFSRGQHTVVLTQGRPISSLVDNVHAAAPDMRIGVGLVRKGLRGARLSIGDAEAALEVAARRGAPVVDFASDWLGALAVRFSDALAPLIAQALGAAHAHPHVAEAVRTYSRSFSVSETARVMHLSPTSVTHRLNRWAKLSGLDPKSFSGLALSIAALDVAGQGSGPQTAPDEGHD